MGALTLVAAAKRRTVRNTPDLLQHVPVYCNADTTHMSKKAADICVSGTKRHHVLTARGGTNELFPFVEARSLPSWLHWASMPLFLPRRAFEVLLTLLLWVMRWLDAILWGSCPRPVEWHCVCHDRTGTARGVPRMSCKAGLTDPLPNLRMGRAWLRGRGLPSVCRRRSFLFFCRNLRKP